MILMILRYFPGLFSGVLVPQHGGQPKTNISMYFLGELNVTVGNLFFSHVSLPYLHISSIMLWLPQTSGSLRIFWHQPSLGACLWSYKTHPSVVLLGQPWLPRPGPSQTSQSGHMYFLCWAFHLASLFPWGSKSTLPASQLMINLLRRPDDS